MPSLGFLKKKRTRDSGLPDPSSPTSPISPSNATAFPKTAAEQQQHQQQHQQPMSALSAGHPALANLPGPTQPSSSAGTGTGTEAQKSPSISNLINPPQSNEHAQPGAYSQMAPQGIPQSQFATSAPQTQQGYNGGGGGGGGMSESPKLHTLQTSYDHQAQQQQQQQQQQEQQHQQALQEQQQQEQQQEGSRQTKGKYTLTDFDILRTLGTGSFGRVHLVQSKHNQRFYAVKVLKKAQVFKMKQVEHTNDERKMLGEVKHPFLITLWGTFQDARNLYMVMDFVEGGELFSLLRKSGRFPNPVAKFYAAEVTLALEYLHAKDIIYRDLKPENLLLDRHGHLKITDFGFAKRVPDKTWTLCGTPDYLAPEVVSNKGYNKSVDWWSLGILIYEMLCGYTPFWDSGSPMRIYENILRGKVKYPAYVNPDAQDLLERLVTPDLTKRLGNLYAGPEDVKTHRWFAEVTWDRLARKDIDAPYTPPVKGGAGDASQFDRYPEDPERYGQGGSDELGHLFLDF